MLPNPRIFRSRWKAMLWAAGILWFAYDIAGSAPHTDKATAGAPTDAISATVNDADLQTIANIIDP